MKVLITGGRTPFALHLTRLFHAAGHEVVVTDSQQESITRFSRLKSKFVYTASIRFARAQFERDLLELIAAERPDLIVPSFEEMFFVSDLLAREGLDVPFFAPDLADALAVHDKARFSALAADLGHAPEENIVLSRPEDVTSFARDPRKFVFKPIYSRFASHVLIGPERGDLGQVTPTPERPWLAQTLIEGTELCAYAVARHGKLVAAAPYENLMRVGTGTSIVYRSIEAPDIEAFLVKFVEKTGWHGQISFDFIRTANGRLYVIEANPRATSGVNLFYPQDGLVEAMLGEKEMARPSRKKVAIKGTVFLVGVLGWFGVVKRQPWVQHLMSSEDSFRFPGEGLLFVGQTRSSSEFFRIAKERDCSVLEATTYDLEWNGEPLESLGRTAVPRRLEVS